MSIKVSHAFGQAGCLLFILARDVLLNVSVFYGIAIQKYAELLTSIK